MDGQRFGASKEQLEQDLEVHLERLWGNGIKNWHTHTRATRASGSDWHICFGGCHAIRHLGLEAAE